MSRQHKARCNQAHNKERRRMAANARKLATLEAKNQGDSAEAIRLRGVLHGAGLL